MEKELVDKIKIKTAVSLNTLLNRVKNSPDKKSEIAKSQGQIASHAVIRKATVTKIFNAKTNPGTATLILIIEAMGLTITDFAEIYESFKTSDFQELEKKLEEIKEKQK